MHFLAQKFKVTLRNEFEIFEPKLKYLSEFLFIFDAKNQLELLFENYFFYFLLAKLRFFS